MKQLYFVIVLTLLTFFYSEVSAKEKSNLLQPAPSDCCSPTEVISYIPGKDKSGNDLPAQRKISDLALGTDDGGDYVSLGFGGSIILKYDFPIANLAGKDLSILETNLAGTDCSVYKPNIVVYVSQDNLGWIQAGQGCQDIQLDIPATFTYIQYIKIIDISAPTHFVDSNSDGYHLDGIKTLQCSSYSTASQPIKPLVECVKDNGDGSYTATFGYKNQNSRYVRILNGQGINELTGGTLVGSNNLPEVFGIGDFHNAFQVTFTTGSVEWKLKGPDNVVRTAVAQPSASKCISAVIRGGGDVCTGSATNIYVDLEGVAPWTVTYKNSNNVPVTVTANQTPFAISVNVPSNYTLKEVIDGNGDQASLFGSARVMDKPIPKATLSAYNGITSTCGEPVKLLVKIDCNCIPFTYTYSVNGKDSTKTTGYQTDTIIGYVGKTYVLKSISNQFCNGIATGTVTVTEKPKPTAEFVSLSDKCASAGVKTFLPVKLTGAKPWTLTYSNGDTEKDTILTASTSYIPGFAGNTYTITKVKDANCLSNINSSIKINLKPTAIASGGGKICHGTTGQVFVQFTGAGPFNFSYSDGVNIYSAKSTTSDTILSGLTGKTYSLISVKDVNDCDGIVSGLVIFSEFGASSASISVAPGKICKGSVLPVKITLLGEAPFEFSYSDGTNTFTEKNYQSHEFEFQGSSGKTYVITSLKDKNCSGTFSGSAFIEEHEVPTASISGGKSICSPTESSTVVFSFTGVAPFIYVYNDGKQNITKTANSNSESLEVKGEGKYELVSVKDSKGCDGIVSGSAQFIIPTLVAAFDLNKDYCYKEIIILKPSYTGATVKEYKFTTTGKGSIVDYPEYSNYLPAENEYGYISFTLTGKDICYNNFAAVTKTTKIKSKVDAAFTFTPVDIKVGEPVEFKAKNEKTSSQVWTINKIQASTETSFVHTFTAPGFYKIALSVVVDNCLESDTVQVDVKPLLPEVYVPNIFSLSTENPESKVVKVYGESVSNEGFRFKIFNKWGNLLYESSDFASANSLGWDGKAPGTGEFQPIGVYTYVLDGKFITGEKFHKTGTVTLVK